MSDWQDEYDDALLKRGHIAGLREAAEMLDSLISNVDYEFTDSPSLLRIMIEEKHDAILTRIAELEKP